MGEIAIKKKAITKILSCFVVIVFLMSSFSVAVIASDSSNSTASNVSDLPVLNDTEISTAKTVSSLGYCSSVWIEITDKYCKGYEVYVDGVYQFTEGEDSVPDGYCRFKVTPGYHTFKLTLNGKEVSKGWNCQCGTGYNWMSMNDMIPHWCEGGGGGGDCDNPPTVSFDKTKYYEGDTVHITVHNPISGQVVDYDIIDCEGNSKEFKALPYGTSSIYYTLPTVSSCCYWKICFYWNEGNPPILGGGGSSGSYCSKCYSFYVCPHETSCKVWVNVEDKYCKGYEVYVDGVYQFTEGESGTPDGYCRFWVTPGTHKFELQKDGCSVSKSWYCQCGTYYSWTSMNDMYPHWCECNKPQEVKFRGTVMDIRGTTPWVQVDNVISGSEYISVGDYTDIACYTTAGETGPCGHCDIVKKGDKVEVYGKRLPIYQIPMVISICGKTSYYMLTIGKPDLVVQDISWIPLNPKQGDNITFTVKIMNQGTGNAKESRLAFGVSKKDANEYCFLRSSTIPSIATGGGYDYTVDYAMTECGIYRIGATADHWVEIEESNEDNNYREESFEIPCEKPKITISRGLNDYKPLEVFTRGSKIQVKLENAAKGEHTFDYLLWRDKNLNLDIDKEDQWIANRIPSFTSNKQEFNREIPKDCPIGLCRLQVDIGGKKYTSNSFFVIFDPNTGLSPQEIKNYWKDKLTGDRAGIRPEFETNHHSEEVMMCMASATSTSFPPDKKTAMSNFSDRIYARTDTSEKKELFPPSSIKDLVLKIKSGEKPPADCDVRSAFLVSLARASGIPAREIYGRGTIFFGWNHAWVEAYYGGAWQVWDPAWRVEFGTNYPGFTDYHKKVSGLKELKKVCDELGVDRTSDYTTKEEKPDLIIQDITCSPSSPKQGDTITFTVKIKNRGDGNAGTSTVKYYIDGSYVDSDTVPSLSVGSTSTQTFTWTANKCGDVQVKAVADATNAIDESNEGNNERTKTLSVTCQNHPPIAYIDAITPNPAIFDPLNVEESETISYSGHGTDPDGDSIIAYNWRSEGGTQLSTSSSFNISSNMFGSGSHTIYFKVKDSHNAWSNEVSKDFLIIYPILTEIKFKGKVLDAAKEPKLAGCLVGITEILEQKGEDVEINVGDEVIAVGLTESERYDTDIKAGDKIKVYGSLYNFPVVFQNLSADFFVDLISSSSFYLNKVAEEKKPDLLVQDIRWSPSNPKQDDTVTFTVTVKNIGKETAGKSHVFIVGINRGANKELFRIEDSCPSLKPGEIYTYYKNAKMENCGEYQLKAWADAQNEVNESNEENNYEDASFEIPCEKPELEKIWITGPTEIKAGETLQWQAYGSYSDGSQKELTSQVSWTVDVSDILQNIGNGKFKGLKGGEATIKIDYEGKSASKKVAVIENENQPPKASFTYEKDGLTVYFTSTSSDPDGDIEIYNWFFGDGGTSNQKNPIHTYSIEGTYTVVLLVRDDKGAVDAYYEDVTIIEPKLPVVILVKNVNNQPLPKCGGEITVKAYRELGNIFDDGFGNKHVAEEREAYKGGDVLSVLTLEVPKDAKFIRVWQKPKIEDGIEEYWGSAEISPPGGVFFTRHTPWLYDIDFDLRSPYTQYINMDVNNEKHVDTTVRNPENTEKKVKVRLILDRDMKLDKDMKYDFDDIGPEEGFEVPSDETDWITFRYTPREDGIWKFRAVVRTLYDDKYWIVTDQHDWYLIVGEKQIMRARSLQYVADYYIGIMSQEGEEVFQDRMAQAWANYSKDIGEILKETAISYDPVAGGLIGVFLDGGGGNSVEKGVKALLDFSQAGLDAWSERFILNKAKDCNICSELDKLKKLAIEEEDCWKSGDKDINKINHVLIEEGKQLAYVEGFIKQFGPDGEVIFPSEVIGVESKIRKEMDKINDAMEAEWDYAGQTYNDLNGLGEYAHLDLVQPENARYYDWTSGRWDAGSDCAQGI